jgi:O-antigen/teichoic acid export membrane protein
MTTGVAGKVTKGAAWMIASQAVDALVGAVATIVLSRLLVPADFGLTALALTLVAILALLRAFSFDLVLIQRQDATRRDYDTAWTFALLFSVLIALLLVIAAKPFALFYDDPRLVPVVMFIALTNVLEGAQNIGIVDFRKDLLFAREFTFVVIRRIGGFLITLALAIHFRNYWSLVIGTVLGQALSTLLSYVMHPYRPRFEFRSWREILGFSKWNAVNAVAHAMSLRAGSFFIGKLGGMGGLGLFNMADGVAFLPSSAIGAPINRAVYPGYAMTAHDPPRLRDAFYRVMALISLVVVPAGVGMAAVADSLTKVMVGPEFQGIAPLIAILAFRGLIHALVSNVPYIYLALGKPQLASYSLLARALILLPLLYVGLLHSGVIGAAWAFTASMMLEIPIHLFLARQQLGVRVRTFLRSVWRPTIAAGLMFVLVRFVSVKWEPPADRSALIARLIALIAAGVVSYVGSVVALWVLAGRPRGAEKMVLDGARERLTTWTRRTESV